MKIGDVVMICDMPDRDRDQPFRFAGQVGVFTHQYSDGSRVVTVKLFSTGKRHQFYRDRVRRVEHEER